MPEAKTHASACEKILAEMADCTINFSFLHAISSFEQRVENLVENMCGRRRIPSQNSGVDFVSDFVFGKYFPLESVETDFLKNG